MATNECIPYFDNGDTLTARCSAAVTGKRFLSVSGPRVTSVAGDGTEGPLITVAMTGAGLGGCIGVSAYDAASGADVTVFHEPSIIVPVKAGGNITAGALVKSDATGQAIAQGGTGVALGTALDTVTTGQDCPVDRSITT